MKRAIIIGAGPAGLTAALELCERTDIRPIVLEQSEYLGGIARTVNYKGNRIDIGGHRFFSKSDRVTQWWLRILPLEAAGAQGTTITYHRQSRAVSSQPLGPDPEVEDNVMLVRSRLSRIYFKRRFFNYPITLDLGTLRKLGPWKVVKMGLSYMKAAMHARPEKSLEDFFINRFGRELYLTFFKSYTEKVWGVPCHEISAEWGAQRVKGLSVWKAILHTLKRMNPFRRRDSITQKSTETSLIERFMYPKFGPGHMWEQVTRLVKEKKGEVLMGWSVERIEQQDQRKITGVWARHRDTGEVRRFEGDYYFSTMPVRELATAMEPEAPAEIRRITDGLAYRDFVTVGLLCNKLKLKDDNGIPRDNWIYVHEPGVLVGRIQIFNNWSPYLIADPTKIWIGLEYFCYETDPIWTDSDAQVIELAKRELASMEVLDPNEVVDATVIRVPKAYPAYFGTYSEFPRVIEWANGFDNLFLIGRNGMHRYNNQDHSMLAAMMAVDNIIAGVRSRDALWELNTEEEYHEEKLQETSA